VGDYALSVRVAPPIAPIAFGGRDLARFNGAGGGLVTISLKGPGSGMVFFDAEGNADPARIVLDGTTNRSSLIIKGDTSVGELVVTGDLRALSGKTADVRGRLTAGGLVSKLQLRGASGLIALGPGVSSVTLGEARDLSLTAGALKSVKVGAWLDTDATADSITAGSLGSLSSRGEFAADVTVELLGKAKVGTLAGSDVRSANGITSFSAGSARDSRIFGGVRPDRTTLPESRGDFVSGTAQLRSVSIRGPFSNVLIAASVVGKAALGLVSSANGGTPFGLTADRAASASGTTDTAGRFRLSRLDDPAGSTSFGDLAIRVV
jgi:hypothetical protein